MSSYVPFDIQVLIIQQKLLPIKSLIRFISVCKAWKSFITSSEFVATYRYPNTQLKQHVMIKYEVGDRKDSEVKFVCYADNDSFPQQKFIPTSPFPQLFDVYRIIDSSCGLLYVDGYFREPDDSIEDMVVLWNPLIRKSIAVGLPTDCKLFQQPDSGEPWPFDHVSGFGVCPQTNDPKLVWITYIEDHKKIESISCIPNQVMVFSLSSGEWTCLCSDRLPRKSIQFDGRFSRGIGQFIYWLAYEWIIVNDGFGYYNHLIMSFDLSTEEFREIELPDSLTDLEDLEPESSLLIFRLKESLALVEFNHPCVVWMMDHDDPKSFTKLFTIEAPHASIEWMLGFSKSGEPILEVLGVDRRNSNKTSSLVVYEPCSGNIKHLDVHGNRGLFYGKSYTESLLLLDHDDGRIIRC